MSFQQTVYVQSAPGVQGDRYDDSPHRALPYNLVSPSAANNLIGTTFCTITSQGVARAGGTGAFAGLLVNSKLYALQGVGGSTLAPTLQLPNNTNVELTTEGRWWVYLPAAANIGDQVLFDTTTGQISTQAPSGTLPVGKAFAQAFVDVYTLTAAGLAVIAISPALVIPT